MKPGTGRKADLPANNAKLTRMIFFSRFFLSRDSRASLFVISDFVIYQFVLIRAIRGIRGRLAPYNWCASPHNSGTGAACAGSQSPSAIFFENFAPPFPEKEVRDENTQERVKKLIY
jgi:hypothetical protein